MGLCKIGYFFSNCAQHVHALLRGKTYEEKCLELGFDSLETRRKNKDLVQTYKIIKEQESTGENGLFTMVGEATGRVTRANAEPLNIKTVRSRLEIRRNNFSVRTVEGWNSLSSEAKCARNISIFKNVAIPRKTLTRRPEEGR